MSLAREARDNLTEALGLLGGPDGFHQSMGRQLMDQAKVKALVSIAESLATLADDANIRANKAAYERSLQE